MFGVIGTEFKLGVAVVIAIFMAYATYFVMHAHATEVALETANASIVALQTAQKEKDKEIATLKKLGEIVDGETTVYVDAGKKNETIGSSVKKKLADDTALILKGSASLGHPPTATDMAVVVDKLSEIRIDSLWDQQCKLYGCDKTDGSNPNVTPSSVTSTVILDLEMDTLNACA